MDPDTSFYTTERKSHVKSVRLYREKGKSVLECWFADKIRYLVLICEHRSDFLHLPYSYFQTTKVLTSEEIESRAEKEYVPLVVFFVLLQT